MYAVYMIMLYFKVQTHNLYNILQKHDILINSKTLPI